MCVTVTCPATSPLRRALSTVPWPVVFQLSNFILSTALEQVTFFHCLEVYTVRRLGLGRQVLVPSGALFFYMGCLSSPGSPRCSARGVFLLGGIAELFGAILAAKEGVFVIASSSSTLGLPRRIQLRIYSDSISRASICPMTPCRARRRSISFVPLKGGGIQSRSRTLYPLQPIWLTSALICAHDLGKALQSALWHVTHPLGSTKVVP